MKRATVIALIVLLIAGAFVSCNYDNIIDDEFNPAIDITSETITLIPGSRYRTVEDTTIADRVTIDGKGTVTIILKEGTTLTAEKGINVTDDQELHIIGEGKLVATGDEKSAGIGGGDGEDSGTIVIQGGEITANGGSEGGAGIGGGKGGKGGTVIIEKLDDADAPEVTTKGGNAGADGIGDGEGATGNPKEIKLDGVGLESSDDEHTWYDYSQEPHYHKQYMRTFDGAIITFNANGGTGEMAAQVVHVNKDENLKANTFTRAGMSFKGWNTKADGSGTAYANKASININADITLYAQWEVAPTGNYITAETTTIQSGLTWTIQDNVVNPNRISIEGTDETAIILPEGLKLEVKQGISVSTGQTLIIDGTGELVAGEGLLDDTNYGKSGIGSSDQYDLGGKIVINGGTITTFAGSSASGIGCSDYPDLVPLPDEGSLIIEINGGIIDSTGRYSAGIGGFKGSILIKGDDTVVHAQVIEGSAGVGIGGNGCSITINGGEVYATGRRGSAGIGSSGAFDEFDANQEIKINGGIITAIGGLYDEIAGAGIGGGYDCGSGTITISGGTITATAGSADADGIGKGSGSGARDIHIDEGVPMFVSEDDIGWSPYAGTPRQYMKTDNVQLNYITSSTTALEAGKIYTISGNVNNNNRLTISGAVTISLPAGRTLTLSKGITVAEGQTLTITGDSTGELVATGLNGNAAIGGASGGTLGTIIINGGVITANPVTRIDGGAGIGNGISSTNGGTVTINGGTVTAYGSDHLLGGGAGIGGGYNSTAAPVIITINGGTINAYGAKSAAGIGGGKFGPANVTINKGTVTATGGNQAYDGLNYYVGGPGIGCGHGGMNVIVDITGGTITANGTKGAAGIGGSGNKDSSSSPTIEISISGGTVTATAGESTVIDIVTYQAAGIGGSYKQPKDNNEQLTITLSGSPQIKATAATADARGIGRGNASPYEGILNIGALEVAAKLRVSADDSSYSDYNKDVPNPARYMKTDNYEEPEP